MAYEVYSDIKPNPTIITCCPKPENPEIFELSEIIRQLVFPPCRKGTHSPFHPVGGQYRRRRVQRLKITATILEGILVVGGQGRR